MNSIMITLKINMVTTQDSFTDTDSFMYEIKTEDDNKDYSDDKKNVWR